MVSRSMRSTLPLALPLVASLASATPGHPFVINTWGGDFTAATDKAFQLLHSNSSASALDAVVAGCATCERNQCDLTVGYGGSPDENCETTLDAMIMDGTTMKSGAVGNLRRVKDAIAVARAVLDHTAHTMLAGDQATDFAEQNGFRVENLTTPESVALCGEWRRDKCQPNYRLNVSPDAKESCGPYEPIAVPSSDDHDAQHALVKKSASKIQPVSHDTISQIIIHQDGTMAAGTSTNGARGKIPGRVGDGPITGSGSYVDGDVGGCGATGDGDIMMRFLPCYQAIESMRQGMSPTEAAEDAVKRILKKFPSVQAGLVVVDKHGKHGGAASGWTFTYAYRGGDMKKTKVVSIEPLNG